MSETNLTIEWMPLLNFMGIKCLCWNVFFVPLKALLPVRVTQRQWGHSLIVKKFSQLYTTVTQKQSCFAPRSPFRISHKMLPEFGNVDLYIQITCKLHYSCQTTVLILPRSHVNLLMILQYTLIKPKSVVGTDRGLVFRYFYGLGYYFIPLPVTFPPLLFQH